MTTTSTPNSYNSTSNAASNYTNRTRNDGTLIIETRTEVPAVLQYADIAEQVKYIPDYDHDFLDCDGLEHYCTGIRGTKADSDPAFYEIGLPDDADAMRGYVRTRDGSGVLTIDLEHARRECWGNGWNNGASRQVQAENIAADIGTTLDYLKKIYEGEAEAYGVVLEFEAPDGTTYSDSCWGIETDDPERDPHAGEIARDIIAEVVGQLEEAGFTIEGQPKPIHVPTHNHRNRNGINGDNWKGETDYSRARARHQRRRSHPMKARERRRQHRTY